MDLWRHSININIQVNMIFLRQSSPWVYFQSHTQPFNLYVYGLFEKFHSWISSKIFLYPFVRNNQKIEFKLYDFHDSLYKLYPDCFVHKKLLRLLCYDESIAPSGTISFNWEPVLITIMKSIYAFSPNL